MDSGMLGVQAQHKGGKGNQADGAGKEQKEPVKARENWLFFVPLIIFLIFVDYCFYWPSSSF